MVDVVERTISRGVCFGLFATCTVRCLSKKRKLFGKKYNELELFREIAIIVRNRCLL